MTGHTATDETKEALVESETRRTAEAFARIVQKHQRVVFAIAYAKTGNIQDAEDVKQDVFVEVWLNMHKLSKVEKVPAWLYKATTNKCVDHFRKKSRRKRREGIFVESAAAHSSNPSPEQHELYETMFRAISLLPETIRTVIMLKHFVKLSYKEISNMTGLSKTTIDGRLRAGKKKLREQLGEMGLEVS